MGSGHVKVIGSPIPGKGNRTKLLPMPPKLLNWTPATHFLFRHGPLPMRATATDGKTVPGRLCDAYYAIGEMKLAEGDRKTAKEFFSKGVETDLPSFSYRFAKAMLRLMQEGKI